MEILTILNTSPMDAEVTFCYLNDSKGDTFLLDPPLMNLKAGESSSLRIWAYPKNSMEYSDTLVCCCKENPEPIEFKVNLSP